MLRVKQGQLDIHTEQVTMVFFFFPTNKKYFFKYPASIVHLKVKEFSSIALVLHNNNYKPHGTFYITLFDDIESSIYLRYILAIGFLHLKLTDPNSITY